MVTSGTVVRFSTDVVDETANSFDFFFIVMKEHNIQRFC